MNQELIEKNKALLEKERDRIKKVLSDEAVPDGKGEFPGDYKPQFNEVGTEEGENASEVEQYTNDLGVVTNLEEQLKKIESALERITAGTYTKCKMGDDIDEKRLAAIPYADTCIQHADA